MFKQAIAHNDPAGIRGINSDQIGLSKKMNNVKAETDTKKNIFYGVLYFGSSSDVMGILHWFLDHAKGGKHLIYLFRLTTITLIV